MGEGRKRDRERWSHDVFINFRGELRDNFVSHLEKAFKSNGIHIFKDDDALKAAEKINTELSKAIKTSKVHLVLLSKTYAHSSWCLDELADIFECSKKDAGHMVVPVFYKVDPSDVRRQKGSFGEPFEKHKSRHPGSKLQKWKEALTQVANLSGFVTGNYRDEAKLIDDVTKEVGKMLSVSYLPLPTYAVGVRSRLHRMNELMCFGSDDVQVIGIGKTTLAKAAFNKFSDRFEGTSFLENFGDCCKKPEGKVHLQRKLLSDISRRDDILFNMEDAMEKRFRNKRVLVVIDDLEDLTQLNSVAIDLSCFGPGSRIIVTSRNTHLLWQLGAKNIYIHRKNLIMVNPLSSSVGMPSEQVSLLKRFHSSQKSWLNTVEDYPWLWKSWVRPSSREAFQSGKPRCDG